MRCDIMMTLTVTDGRTYSLIVTSDTASMVDDRWRRWAEYTESAEAPSEAEYPTAYEDTKPTGPKQVDPIVTISGVACNEFGVRRSLTLTIDIGRVEAITLVPAEQ